MRLPRVRKAMRRSLGRPPAGVRAWRPQWLPWSVELQTESVAHPHMAEERAEAFLAYDPGTAEMEVLNWLYATICLTKPAAVLETGSHEGFGTLALAAACRANGFGRVHSVEIAPESCSHAASLLERAGLSAYATIHCADSRDFLRNTPLRFQVGFFDSLPEIRAEEFSICLDRRILSRVAVFHDTSPLRTKTLQGWPSEDEHRKFREDLVRLAGLPETTGFFESRLSRGLFVIFLRGPD